MMKRKLDYLCPVVFCLFLLLISTWLVFGKETEYSEREKRYLTTKPEFSVAGVLDGTVQMQLKEWVGDQLPLRDVFVGIDAYSMLLSGRNGLQDIYYAKDGYLINAPNSQDMGRIQKTLTKFDSFAEKAGVPSSLILIPTGGWMMEELLPLSAREYLDESCFAQARSLQNIRYLEYHHVLSAAKKTMQVLYRTDHHLTSTANYELYRQWCEDNAITAHEKDEYTIETISGFYGTTWSGSGYWLAPADTIEIWDRGADVTVTITDDLTAPAVVSDTMFYRSRLDELDKYPVFLDGNHSIVEIEARPCEGNTLLVIKDSYAHGFVPFLVDHYEKIIMLDLRSYRGDVSAFIEENGVDEILFFYGVSTLLTDTNSAFLF